MTTEIKRYTFADGTGTAYDLDNGDAVIDFVSNTGERIAQITVCYDNGNDKAWQNIDSDLIGNEIKAIEDVLTDPFPWENGMGGSPFDSEYWTEF